jgi:hypothetical protein
MTVRIDTSVLTRRGPQRLALRLPGVAQPVFVTRTEIPGVTDAWTGIIEGDPSSDVTLVVSGQGVIGVISTSGGQPYQLRPLADGMTLLEQIDDTPALDAGLEPDPRPEPSGAATHVTRHYAMTGCPTEPTACDAGAMIDVLVAYTDAAREWAGGMHKLQGHLRAAIARANSSLNRSGVWHRIRLKATMATDWAESGTPQQDLAALTQFGAEWSLAIRERRDSPEVGADLVVLITAASNGDGYAYGPRDCPDRDRAYAVVAVQSLRARNALAHEVGHLLGAGHINEPGFDDYSRAFRQTSPAGQCRGFSTIMDGASLCPKCVRLNAWSAGADARKHCGEPLGDARADNSATVMRSACEVAQYATQVPGL